MTSVVEPAGDERSDVRTIVRGGVKLGVVTAVGVTGFAVASRSLGGAAELAAQSVLVLAGGLVAGYLPAFWVRPRSADAIAWAALVGLLGALVFTVLDTAILRPVGLYHWTWDAIGGGSGFWYIPVWWMGAAVLAWLGAWVASSATSMTGAGRVVSTALQTAGLGLGWFVVLGVSGLLPWHPATMALAVALALAVHVPLGKVLARR